METLAVVTAAGASTGLLVSLVLYGFPFGQKVANTLLSIFVLILSVYSARLYMSYTGLVSQYPNLQGITLFINFSLGPLLYFYTRTISEKGFLPSKRHLWHGLPVLISFAFYIPTYIQPAEVKQLLIDSYLAAGKVSWQAAADPATESALRLIVTINFYQYLLFALQLLVYTLLALNILNRHSRALHQHFSATERIKLNWLRALVWLVLLTAAAILLYVLSIRATGGGPGGFVGITTTVLVVFLIYFMGYMGLRQPAIYSAAETAEDKPVPTVESTELPADEAAAPSTQKYEKSGLSGDSQKACWESLQALMAEKKPYLIAGLTIGQLAELLELPVAYLSQTINSEADMSFFDYINSHRISEAKSLLQEQVQQQGQKEGRPIALSTFYLDVGFNSKSSFYTQFKKYTDNQTPREYLQSLKQRVAEEKI